MCENAGKFVKIERVAPDLVFAHLPQLTNVKNLGTLGKGAFGLVYLGETEEGTKVAVKELLMPPDISDEIVLEKFHEFHHEVSIARSVSLQAFIFAHSNLN